MTEPLVVTQADEREAVAREVERWPDGSVKRRNEDGDVLHGCEMCDGDDECTCPGNIGGRKSFSRTSTPQPMVELRRAIDAIVGDLGQIDGDGCYNGVVHCSDVEYLERCFAALTPDTAAIPEGMRAWDGGEGAPSDWDGGEVRLRFGGLDRAYSDDRRWNHDRKPKSSDVDIIAYMSTPAPVPATREGWVCVPIVSTQDMQDAATEVLVDTGRGIDTALNWSEAAEVWSAMLAAAPSAPRSDAGDGWRTIDTAPAATGAEDDKILVCGGRLKAVDVVMPDGDYWRTRKAQGATMFADWWRPLPAPTNDRAEVGE